MDLFSENARFEIDEICNVKILGLCREIVEFWEKCVLPTFFDELNERFLISCLGALSKLPFIRNQLSWK